MYLGVQKYITTGNTRKGIWIGGFAINATPKEAKNNLQDWCAKHQRAYRIIDCYSGLPLVTCKWSNNQVTTTYNSSAFERCVNSSEE